MTFPLAIYYISNPADADGSTYLNEKFVKGPYPFFEMNFWHNPYIDKEKYLANLRELSKADYQYQIQNHIDHTCLQQIVQRSSGVSDGTQHRRPKVIDQHRRHTDKIYPDI